MKDKIDRYKELLISEIKSFNNLKTMYDNKLAKFQTDNADLIDEIQESRDNINNIQTEIKGLAKAIYDETKINNIDDDVKIKVYTHLNYDEDKAFEWAKEHSLCLTLDKTAFKRIAKNEKIDFVSIEEEPKCTLTAKLKI